MKIVTILGSTGSIGSNTLDIVRRNKKDFKIYALTAHNNEFLLYKQCLEFKPKYAVISCKRLAEKLREKISLSNIETNILYGQDSLIKVSTEKIVDIIVAGIVGCAGLLPVFYAVKKGKKILLANKESLVIAGQIIMKEAQKSGSDIIPIDSEHSAIFQCLPDNKKYNKKDISKIILTASGGPFFNKSLKEFDDITPDKACSHPIWKMGKKISIDSSTMTNKALEIVEAYWLFKVPINKIQVLIHPQSIVHSMIEYCDGSFISQMSFPDMRIPINYGLYYPKRSRLNISKFDFINKTLNFYKIDIKKFPIISLVYNILKHKNYSSLIVLNAANEILVDAFLLGRIKFLKIIYYIEQTLKQLIFDNPININDVLSIDSETRAYVSNLLNKY